MACVTFILASTAWAKALSDRAQYDDALYHRVEYVHADSRLLAFLYPATPWILAISPISIFAATKLPLLVSVVSIPAIIATVGASVFTTLKVAYDRKGFIENTKVSYRSASVDMLEIEHLKEHNTRSTSLYCSRKHVPTITFQTITDGTLKGFYSFPNGDVTMRGMILTFFVGTDAYLFTYCLPT